MTLGDAVDYDLLLDALSSIGSGSYATFRRIVEQQDDRPWAANEAARSLVALGHIDVQLDDLLRPRSWSVAPATLVASPTGAFLAGWRSPELLFALGRAAHDVAGRVEWTQQVSGPTRIGLWDIDDGDFDAVARRTSEIGPADLAVSRGVPLRLTQLLPPLATLRLSLPRSPTVPHSLPLFRLDVETLRWNRADSLRVPGAYQAGQRPRLIIHTDGADARVAEIRLAKWLAVDRTPLLAYDPDRRCAICHLGTEPPALYERALVLCSGLLPTRVKGHLVEYSNIPPEVVSALADRLTARTEINA